MLVYALLECLFIALGLIPDPDEGVESGEGVSTRAGAETSEEESGLDFYTSGFT